MPAEIKPVDSESITRENGRFAIETITSDTSGPSKNGPVVEQLPNGKVVRSRVSNYASGMTVDLLSVYYYMRQVNYAEYSPGQSFVININNPGGADVLTINYIGKCSVGTHGMSQETFHATLSFSEKDSSVCDTIEAWITSDDTRTPLLIKASLPIGHMLCRYVGDVSL